MIQDLYCTCEFKTGLLIYVTLPFTTLCRVISVIPPTCAKVQSDSPQEVLVPHPVVVPDGELEAPVCQVLHAELLPGEGLVPPGRGRLPTHSSLLLPTTVTGQQISAIILLISL